MENRCCRCAYNGFCLGDGPDGCCVTVNKMNRDTYEEVKSQVYSDLGWHKDDEWYKDPQ